MAVQAQYPSNVLLLNSNGQDRKNSHGNDYSLQQQQSGAFHDQSHHMFFNSNTTSNGVGSNNNSRKRGRETVNGGNMPINLFSLQQQSQTQTQPTLVNIAHLQNQQQHNNIVSTGLQLAFGEHHQQQVQHHQQLNLVHQSSSSSSLSSLLTDDFSVQLNQLRDEIDQFIKAQGDQLRRTLAERGQRHYHALLGIAEESVSKRLREKEAEMEKAVRKNSELEARVAQLRAEAQSWQAKAKSQEETAVNLQTQLQHAMMNGGGGAQNIKRDKESVTLGCAGGGGGEAEDAESAYIDPERVLPISVSSTATSLVGPSCKACRRRVASVVLVPCRHLCLCTECDTAVEACPLCLSYRSSSVEVYLS